MYEEVQMDNEELLDDPVLGDEEEEETADDDLEDDVSDPVDPDEENM